MNDVHKTNLALCTRIIALLFMITVAFFAFSTRAVAGPGHDHGHEAPTTTTAPASPRFAASSDLFEVVGILNAKALSVFVDRFETNEPVTQASVEIDINGMKKVGKLRADTGDFVFPPEQFAKPGNYAIALTITAGDDIDILAANLVVPELADDSHQHGFFTWQNALIALLAVVLSIVLVFAIRSLITRRKQWGGNHA